MSLRLLILIFVIIYPKVSYWWIGTSLWKQKQFLKLAHDTVYGSMWETSLGIHQIVKPIVHSGGGGLKKKNFFLNQIYFEIGMFIYIVSSRVYNCAYLWNAPLVKIYVSGLVHFPRSVCLFSVNALILRCTVAEVFDVILHSLSLLKWQVKLLTSRQNVNTQTINSTFMFTQHIKRLIQMAMSEWYI